MNTHTAATVAEATGASPATLQRYMSPRIAPFQSCDVPSRGSGEKRGYRFHDNRHTAATGILRATGNLKAVQKLLRHSDVSTTAKYAHALIDDVRDAMEAGEKSRNKSRTDDGESVKPLAANGENV